MPTSTGRTAATPPPDRNDLDSQLAATSRGNLAAFEELYERTAPRVHGLALRILRDVHQAEEVTQEVFLEAWRLSARFDPERGSALTWLMTMAHHRAVDRVRRTASARRREAADVGRSHGTAFDETSAAVQASAEAQEVRAALDTLTALQRQAIELTYFGGHTYNDMATLLQIPLSTAKSRIRAALLRLREALSPAVEPA